MKDANYGAKIICVAILDGNTAKYKIGETYTAVGHRDYHTAENGYVPGFLLKETDLSVHPVQDFISWPDEIDRRKSDAER